MVGSAHDQFVAVDRITREVHDPLARRAALRDGAEDLLELRRR